MGEGEEGRYSAPQAYGPVRLWLDRGRPAPPSLRLLALMLCRSMADRSRSEDSPHSLRGQSEEILAHRTGRPEVDGRE
ncbi:MAG TPA: hypothetical protein PK224_15360 [Nitrospira sp.]|jgi:hypothetical protein|nr:hypothetical protein [Nitrospira sp.]